MEFNDKIDAIVNSILKVEFREGMTLQVSKLISDAIRVSDKKEIPEGDYLIWAANPDRYVLVSTSESSNDTFEVFKKTLNGFYNPEVHNKRIIKNKAPLISEA